MGPGHSLEVVGRSQEAAHSPEAEGSRSQAVGRRSQAVERRSQAVAHNREVVHTAHSAPRSEDLLAEGLQLRRHNGQPLEEELRSHVHNPVAGSRLEADSQQLAAASRQCLEVGRMTRAEDSLARLRRQAPVHRDRTQLPEEGNQAARSGMRSGTRTDRGCLAVVRQPVAGMGHRQAERHTPAAARGSQAVEPGGRVHCSGPTKVVHHMESREGRVLGRRQGHRKEGTWLCYLCLYRLATRK